MSKLLITLFAVALVAVMLSAAPNALAQGEGAPAKTVTKIGYLNCREASGWGFIFGSSRRLQCVYTPAEKGKKIEDYSGSISKFGADIGYLRSAVILWAVLSPGKKITENPGLLAGHYGGASEWEPHLHWATRQVLVGLWKRADPDFPKQERSSNCLN